MAITRFSHFTIRCKDLDASTAFYRDVLGMDVRPRPLPEGFGRGAIGYFADDQWCVHLFEATAEQTLQFEALPERKTAILMHVSLRAEGYVETMDRLRAKAISLREFTIGDRHLVQFLDLDGLEIELTFSPDELPNGPVPWTPA
jgi:catechol 2,3-dioxygenase-like lactoylglutathione lyase family enzyme